MVNIGALEEIFYIRRLVLNVLLIYLRKGCCKSMCVGLPAMVESVENGSAVVNSGGARREISVEFISDIKPGDYVMIHAGMAIARITADEAQETQSILEELYAVTRDIKKSDAKSKKL